MAEAPHIFVDQEAGGGGEGERHRSEEITSRGPCLDTYSDIGFLLKNPQLLKHRATS